MFTAAAASFVLWSAMFTCWPTTATAVESITVTLEWRASIIAVSPSLLNAVDRRLLFIADREVVGHRVQSLSRFYCF